ncbi:hypothetical protein TKK_0019277 [Trichogramma kaykai]
MAVKFTKVRYLFAIMLCIANMIIYGQKVNITVAMHQMSKEMNSDGSFIEPPTGETRYEWTEEDKQDLSTFYFAGYMCGMFMAGYFADRFNTKVVLLICVLANALGTLLVPFCAFSLALLYAIRFIMGLISAANLPIVNICVGKWVVYEEKSMWVAIIYAGTSLGTVISMFTSSWIIELSNWQMVFYIHGVLPLIWCLVYFMCFTDSPEDQKLITEEERALIVNSFGHRTPNSAGKKALPWKAIFTSKPFLALLVTNTLGNFTWYFLLTQMTTFMIKVLKFNNSEIKNLIAIPYLLGAIFNSCFGKLLDYGRKSGWWSQTIARKIAVTISCIPAIILLPIIMSLDESQRYLSFGLLTLTIIFSGSIFIGHLTNQNDLAPNFAGILMGITNTPGTLPACINPKLVGALVKDVKNGNDWLPIFILNIACQIGAFLVFIIFGSGEIQDWNYPGGVRPPPPK